jgi:hypothetical protein
MKVPSRPNCLDMKPTVGQGRADRGDAGRGKAACIALDQQKSHLLLPGSLCRLARPFRQWLWEASRQPQFAQLQVGSRRPLPLHWAAGHTAAAVEVPSGG